jgi:hypothetical protein
MDKEGREALQALMRDCVELLAQCKKAAGEDKEAQNRAARRPPRARAQAAQSTARDVPGNGNAAKP